MNILLIKPTRLDESKQPIKYRKALLPPLPLAILDRLTPHRHQVKILDDIVENIDYSRSYDLVGISAMTVQAERAYQVADRFREMGVKVIMGGIHPSVLPFYLFILHCNQYLWQNLSNKTNFQCPRGDRFHK